MIFGLGLMSLYACVREFSYRFYDLNLIIVNVNVERINLIEQTLQ